MTSDQKQWNVAACTIRTLESSPAEAPKGTIPAPALARRFCAQIVWRAKRPLVPGRPYLLEYGTDPVRRFLRPYVPHSSAQPVDALEVETHLPLGLCGDAESGFLIVDPANDEILAAGFAQEPRADWVNRAGAVLAGTQRGFAIWFTGLSSAGKSTLAEEVGQRLRSAGAREVALLDGDAMRRGLCRNLGFSKEDRDENIRRIAFAAEVLVRAGVIALVSAISPYRFIRAEARRNIGDFVEVYVNAPLSICEQRDVKGLYRRARAGEVRGFTGIDDPYEPPLSPEVECPTGNETPAQSASRVVRYLEAHRRYAVSSPSPTRSRYDLTD